MVAINEPVGQVQAFLYRLTLLDTNGVPTPGASSGYTHAGIVSLRITPAYKDGTHIEQENGAGELCVNYDGDDSLLRCDFELIICTPDPYAMALAVEGSKAISAVGVPTTSGSAGVAADPNRPYGWAMPAIGPLPSRLMSIEVWSKRIDNGDLVDVYPYAWWVLPATRRRRAGEVTLANGAVVPSITGKAYQNLNWFDGPRENWPSTSDRVLQWIPCRASELPAASNQYSTVTSS